MGSTRRSSAGPVPENKRFELLKRWGFNCDSCGASAVDIALYMFDSRNSRHADETDDVTTMRLMCCPCASRKEKKPLHRYPGGVSRPTLAALRWRAEQLEMMIRWLKELVLNEDSDINGLRELVLEMSNRELRGHWPDTLSKLCDQYSVAEVHYAIEVAMRKYLVRDESDPIHYETDSVDVALNKIAGVCYLQRAGRDDPGLKKLYWIRAILRGRLQATDEDYEDGTALSALRRARDAGVGLDQLQLIAEKGRDWTDFRDRLDQAIQTHSAILRAEESSEESKDEFDDEIGSK